MARALALDWPDPTSDDVPQVLSVRDGDARDYYLVCPVGHASVSMVTRPTVLVCEACAAVRVAERRFVQFAERASISGGYRREA